MQIYFKLIRWKNLLLIIYIYVLIKLLLFPSLLIETTLNIFLFFILLFSILFISAAGYIINDIEDIIADSINKPKKQIISKNITKERALQWYKLTNTIGIALGITFSLKIGKPTFAFIFIGAALLLYFYSKKLKGKPFIGNFTIAFLIGICIILLGFFEFNFPIKNEHQNLAFNIIILLSIFAFLINLTREIIKDIEDINGDYALKMKTLPIILGINRTKNIALFTTFLTIGLLMYLILNFSVMYKFTILYLLITVMLPLVYIFLKLFSAKNKTDFKKISILLKISMFLGVNSLVIFSKFI